MMTNNALIGHTGFVGGTLLRQSPFAATFNSRNIEDIRGRHFDRVVCAGVSAVKWLANREPERDWQGINRLIECLQEVAADHFVLISTIDVYREPVGLTERDLPPTDGLHSYGLHRLRLEQFIAERFPVHTIIRLPALFGDGLRKNALYDLIHFNQTDNIIPNSRFQWYPTRRLSGDLDRIVAGEVDLINITSEPILMELVRDRFFPGVPLGPSASVPPLYDLRTVYANLLGGNGEYHLTAVEVLEEMRRFVAESTGAENTGVA